MPQDLVLKQLDDDGVLTVTLNRPERRNAFNSAGFLALRDALAEANGNPKVAVVLLTGAGDDFSTGLDLSEVGGEEEGEPPAFEQMMDALCALDKPLIAAAKGYAIGFGTTVLFHCDVVYLGQSTKLKMPFASLGLVTEAAAAYLAPISMGRKQAAELLFTAETFDAQKALDYGIATQLLPDESLLSVARAKAREMAQWPIESLVEIKRLMKAPHAEEIARVRKLELQGFAKLMGSPGNVEAFTAFLEKRPPNFKQFRK